MALINVGMGDLKVCKCPDALTTLALGSCIGIALYDPVTKIGGLAHIMLPDSTAILRNTNRAKFADTAIDDMIDQMIRLGASPQRITAKLAGGAQMFAVKGKVNMMNIGEQNEAATRQKLRQVGIRVVGSDCGKDYGRTVVFYTETGVLEIKSIGKTINRI